MSITENGLTITAKNGTTTLRFDTEARDMLNQKTAQLSGLLSLMNFEGGEYFRMLGPREQERVMWLADALSSEVNLLAEVATSSGEEC